MTHYLDTSVLIAALTPDWATGTVHDWLQDHATNALGLSDWTITEAASALSMKVRLGYLDVEQRTNVDAVLTAWIETSLERIPVPRAAFADAARFLRRHDTGVRASGALHLATSALHGARLVTVDQRLAEAGDALGIDAVLI